MDTLVDEFMKPIAAPEAYKPQSDIVSWAVLDGGTVVPEVFHRKEGTFGFRYCARVAWRDAGDEVRSHSWHVLLAEADAKQFGMALLRPTSRMSRLSLIKYSALLGGAVFLAGAVISMMTRYQELVCSPLPSAHLSA